MKTDKRTGERIRHLRKKNGLTQTEIAQKVGLKTSAFSCIELSKNKPTSELIIELSSLFNVSTDYLLTGKEDKTMSHEELELIEIYRNDNQLKEVLKTIVLSKKKIIDCLSNRVIESA
jgi:transcriptional regulator with XRE-family HTH domain